MEFEQDMKKFGDANNGTIRMSGGGDGTGAPRRVVYIFKLLQLCNSKRVYKSKGLLRSSVLLWWNF